MMVGAAVFIAPLVAALAPANQPPPPLDSGTRTNRSPEAVAASLKQEAVDIATGVAKTYPHDALSEALLGSAHYNTGQSEVAKRHLLRCLDLNPAQTDAYEILARMAYDRGDPQEVVRLARKLAANGPLPPALLNLQGRAHMDLGETEEALRALLASTKLPGTPAESHYLLGQALLQAGRPSDAESAFLAVVARVPDHTQAYFGLLTAARRLGRETEAREYGTRFQQLESADRKLLTDRSAEADGLNGLALVRRTAARTLMGAAQIYRTHHQAEKANELFVRAATLDPDQSASRAALEAQYILEKRLADGVAQFARLAAEQPNAHLNHLFLGRLQARLQDFDAAEKSYRKVQELAPGWPEGYRALADLLLRSNRNPAEARANAEKALELEPNPNHLYTTAMARLRTGDQKGALDALNQAATLAPDDPRIRKLLQQLATPAPAP